MFIHYQCVKYAVVTGAPIAGPFMAAISGFRKSRNGQTKAGVPVDEVMECRGCIGFKHPVNPAQ